MSGFWYGLIAAFSFGTADFIAGKSSRRLGSMLTLLYMQMVGLILLTGWLSFTNQWSELINEPRAIGLAMLYMGLDLLGILALYQAMTKGNVSIVTPIASSFASVTVVLAIIFGERPTGVVLVGICLTILGVVLASIQRSSNQNTSKGGIFWAVISSLLLGIAFFGIQFPAEELGAFATVWVGRAQAVIFLPLLMLFVSGKKLIPNPKEWIWIILVGILDAVAFISYNIGLMLADTSLVVTMTSLFAVFTICWGVLLWKEKINWNQWIGLVCIFTGLICITP